MVRFFSICVRITNGSGKRPWLRIGSAAESENGLIDCTINAAPLDWDGKFTLIPADQKASDKDEG